MSTPRRARFVVTINLGGDLVEKPILAYSATNATDYYRRRGYRIVSVRKLARGHYAPKPTDGGFRVNEANLRRAIAELGLTWPVEIKQTGHQGGRRGAYRPLGKPARHKITIKNYLTPEQAGRCLWHELVHGMQAERIARATGCDPSHPTFTREWNGRDKGIGYANKPKEREANSYMDRNDEIPLARK